MHCEEMIVMKKNKIKRGVRLGCLRPTVPPEFRIRRYTINSRLQNENPGNAFLILGWVCSPFIKGKPQLEDVGVEKRMGFR